MLEGRGRAASEDADSQMSDEAAGDLRAKNLVRFLGMRDGVTPSIAMQGDLVLNYYLRRRRRLL